MLLNNIKKLSNFELGWLIGVIEGEGCATQNRGIPLLQVKMTDFDIIQKIKIIYEPCGYYNTEQPINKLTGKLYKKVYCIRLWGLDAIILMKEIVPFMGIRRKERMEELINCWDRGQKLIDICNNKEKEIKTLYKVGNCTQTELAKKFGITERHVYCIIHRKKPRTFLFKNEK